MNATVFFFHLDLTVQLPTCPSLDYRYFVYLGKAAKVINLSHFLFLINKT